MHYGDVMHEEVVEEVRICVYVRIRVCVRASVCALASIWRADGHAFVSPERSARTRSRTKCWATSRTTKWWKDS